MSVRNSLPSTLADLTAGEMFDGPLLRWVHGTETDLGRVNESDQSRRLFQSISLAPYR